MNSVVTKKQVILYCRVSTQDQENDRQIADLTEFCAAAGYEVISAYSEKCSGVTKSRPERNKLLSLVAPADGPLGSAKVKIDYVLVTELSRWGRSLIDVVETIEQLQKHQVKLKLLSGMEFDLDSPIGAAMLGMLGVFAQLERDLIRERVVSGLKQAKANGVKLGARPGKSIKRRDEVLDLLKEHSVREVARRTGLHRATVRKIKSESAA